MQWKRANTSSAPQLLRAQNSKLCTVYCNHFPTYSCSTSKLVEQLTLLVRWFNLMSYPNPTCVSHTKHGLLLWKCSYKACSIWCIDDSCLFHYAAAVRTGALQQAICCWCHAVDKPQYAAESAGFENIFNLGFLISCLPGGEMPWTARIFSKWSWSFFVAYIRRLKMYCCKVVR